MTEEGCRDYLSSVAVAGRVFAVHVADVERRGRCVPTLFHSSRCNSQKSMTAGTVFQDTRKPLATWLRAMWFVTSQKIGVSVVWSKNSICLNPIMVAGRTGYPGKAFQNGSNTTLHGPQLTCNVFLAAVRRVGTSPMDPARSSIFTLRVFQQPARSTMASRDPQRPAPRTPPPVMRAARQWRSCSECGAACSVALLAETLLDPPRIVTAYYSP